MSGPKSGLTLPAPENAVLLGVRHLHKNHTEQDVACTGLQTGNSVL